MMDNNIECKQCDERNKYFGEILKNLALTPIDHPDWQSMATQVVKDYQEHKRVLAFRRLEEEIVKLREERVADCDEAWDYGYEKGKKEILSQLKTTSPDDWERCVEVAWDSIEESFKRGHHYPKAAKHGLKNLISDLLLQERKNLIVDVENNKH